MTDRTVCLFGKHQLHYHIHIPCAKHQGHPQQALAHYSSVTLGKYAYSGLFSTNQLPCGASFLPSVTETEYRNVHRQVNPPPWLGAQTCRCMLCSSNPKARNTKTSARKYHLEFFTLLPLTKHSIRVLVALSLPRTQLDKIPTVISSNPSI